MFFGIAQERYNDLAPEVQVFLSLAHGYHNAVPIVRATAQDKEFHFQNWVRSRIAQSGLRFEPQGRHGYPDFVLSDHAAGFEVKGLSVNPVTGAGRVNDFDCNSQLPLAEHDGRKVFYIFGRYPLVNDTEYMVTDLVLCSASFLNTETVNTNENQSFRGAGSYGDILIRDRRMFVCRTPYGLANGTKNQATMILERTNLVMPPPLVTAGELERREAEKLVAGYSFDLQTNELTSKSVPNPSAGRVHRFTAFKIGPNTVEPVSMIP